MKNVLFFTLALITCFVASAQKIQRYQIAIFTPLYLDSVYDSNGSFLYEKNTFPRFVIPGLEFYQGVQAAIDSLEKRNAPLEFFIYDSRGKKSMSELMEQQEMDSIDLIIAHTNAPETRFLAESALKKKIPFISASLPNDAGVAANPYYVILNSTLQTHIESIYEFVQKNHSLDNIVVFRKPGAQEDMLKKYIEDFSRLSSGKTLDIKFVDLSPKMRAENLKAHLDSNRRNIILAGSLDQNFANKLLSEVSAINSTYPLRVIGMPTWERLNYSKLSGVEIIYTTPFFYNRQTALQAKLDDDYNEINSTAPGEMFFRGYETALRFAFLLLDAKEDISSSIGRKGNTVFTTFDIQPVFRDPASMTLDYFENKNLYFIKNFGGSRFILQQ